MNGVKMLCGSCYGNRQNHSSTVETILISQTDRRYLGSPKSRCCDQCKSLVPFSPSNPQADPFTGKMRALSQCCNEPIVQAGFMSETWPECSGCNQPIGNRGPNKKAVKA